MTTKGESLSTKVRKGNLKQIVGTVTSDRMAKTIVVRVDRKIRHSDYGKYIVVSRQCKAHDEKNAAKIGDRVILMETRPLSRDKRWILRKVLSSTKMQKAGVAELEVGTEA